MSAVSSRLCVMGSRLVSVMCMSHSRTGVMVAGIEVKCATIVATSVGHVDARMTLVEE